MDQLTHTVRRSNWINIIRQCQDRPAGTTAKQWLAEMIIPGISEPPVRTLRATIPQKESHAFR